MQTTERDEEEPGNWIEELESERVS
jgi:hypothetical protein